eukprot:1141788-Pelagomonas_calceolata.AAC.3
MPRGYNTFAASGYCIPRKLRAQTVTYASNLVATGHAIEDKEWRRGAWVRMRLRGGFMQRFLAEGANV